MQATNGQASVTQHTRSQIGGKVCVSAKLHFLTRLSKRPLTRVPDLYEWCGSSPEL